MISNRSIANANGLTGNDVRPLRSPPMLGGLFTHSIRAARVRGALGMNRLCYKSRSMLPLAVSLAAINLCIIKEILIEYNVARRSSAIAIVSPRVFCGRKAEKVLHKFRLCFVSSGRMANGLLRATAAATVAESRKSFRVILRR